MHPIKLGRRDLLRGLGAAAAALPIMNITSAGAQSNTFPTRLIVVFSPNGTIHENWVPTGTETDWTLSRILTPLERHKSSLIVLDGVKNEAAYNGPGDGHMTGMGCLLTGTELLEGTQFSCGGTDPCSGWGGGISVDQHIANQIGGDTKFRSLEFSVQSGGADIWSRMVYSGADSPIAPMDDPAQAFERIFGDLTIDTAALERLRAQRKSVLDYVGANLSRLQGKLGGEDRDKLGAHLEAIQDIERRLTSGSLAGCSKPPDPDPALNARSNDSFPAVVDLQTKLLVRAMACDQTRVATLQWSRSVGGTRMTWLGLDRGHHDYSHDGDSVTDTIEALTQINVWYAEQFAALLDELKAVPEGSGTMLDHSLVVWVNELGRGNSHSREKIPIVMAGSANGYFQTNRFLQYDKDPHNNLLVSICNAMGVQTSTFGNPAYATGPLARLV